MPDEMNEKARKADVQEEKVSKRKNPGEVLVNTILGLIIACVILAVISIVSLCVAISAKKEIRDIYTFSGESIIDESEDYFYFDGENFVGVDSQQ